MEGSQETMGSTEADSPSLKACVLYYARAGPVVPSHISLCRGSPKQSQGIRQSRCHFGAGPRVGTT